MLWYKQHQLRRFFQNRGQWWTAGRRSTAYKWVLVVLIGVLVGFSGAFVQYVTELLTEIRFHHSTNLIDEVGSESIMYLQLTAWILIFTFDASNMTGSLDSGVFNIFNRQFGIRGRCWVSLCDGSSGGRLWNPWNQSFFKWHFSSRVSPYTSTLSESSRSMLFCGKWDSYRQGRAHDPHWVHYWSRTEPGKDLDPGVWHLMD